MMRRMKFDPYFITHSAQREVFHLREAFTWLNEGFKGIAARFFHFFGVSEQVDRMTGALRWTHRAGHLHTLELNVRSTWSHDSKHTHLCCGLELI